MQPTRSVPEPVLLDLLNHAASAARLVGHRDDPIAAGPLGKHVDAIVHGLTELLGDPHTLAAPEQSARSMLASHELAPALDPLDPARFVIRFADDESMRPHKGRFRSLLGSDG